MSNLTLKAKKREAGKSALDKLRAGGFVPGVVYGGGRDGFSIYLNQSQAHQIEKEAEKASIVTLEIEGEKEVKNVIIQDMQHDKLTDNMLHVDFYEVDMTKEIETEVPLTFVGQAPAVKDLGGIFLHNLEEVGVKCLPGNLPAEIKIDIGGLKTFEDMIYVKDLAIPEGVEILAGPDELIAMVSAPRTEEELEELDEEVAEDVSQVEGVADKKEEEGEEGGEEKKEEGGEAEEKPAEEKKEE